MHSVEKDGVSFDFTVYPAMFTFTLRLLLLLLETGI